MARPSKLTETQWNEILKRVVGGESIRSLAKEFGITETAIRKRVSLQAEKIKIVSNQIIKTEMAVKELPVSSQVIAYDYASQLRAISDNLTGAALNQSKTSKIISELANAKAETLSQDSHEDDFKEVAVKIKVANEASVIPLALLNANKDTVKVMNDGADKSDGEIPTDNIAASRAYQKMLNG